MCELLGMECNVPTDIAFSFTALALRGGRTGPHADGWGIALYDGLFAQTFLEPRPACDSALAAFLRDHPIRSLLAIAHVRRKTRGEQRLANTHPFKRVMWGRDWTFAHNGTLPEVRGRALRRFTPIGETDSEHAFCWLLDHLFHTFPAGYPDDAAVLYEALAAASGELGVEGAFNFLLGDGQRLFARCGTKLSHLIRQAPFGSATLRDTDVRVDFSTVTTHTDRVAVVATEPLTRDEVWTHGTPGTLWVFRQGTLVATLASRDPAGRPEWVAPPEEPAAKTG